MNDEKIYKFGRKLAKDFALIIENELRKELLKDNEINNDVAIQGLVYQQLSAWFLCCSISIARSVEMDHELIKKLINDIFHEGIEAAKIAICDFIEIKDKLN